MKCHTYLLPLETRNRKISDLHLLTAHGEIQLHKLYLSAEGINIFTVQHVLGNSSEAFQEKYFSKEGTKKQSRDIHYSIKTMGKARSHGYSR